LEFEYTKSNCGWNFDRVHTALSKGLSSKSFAGIYTAHIISFFLTGIITGLRPMHRTHNSRGPPWVLPGLHHPPDHTALHIPATIAVTSCMPLRPAPSPLGPVRRHSKLLNLDRHSAVSWSRLCLRSLQATVPLILRKVRMR